MGCSVSRTSLSGDSRKAGLLNSLEPLTIGEVGVFGSLSHFVFPFVSFYGYSLAWGSDIGLIENAIKTDILQSFSKSFLWSTSHDLCTSYAQAKSCLLPMVFRCVLKSCLFARVFRHTSGEIGVAT